MTEHTSVLRQCVQILQESLKKNNTILPSTNGTLQPEALAAPCAVSRSNNSRTQRAPQQQDRIFYFFFPT